MAADVAAMPPLGQEREQGEDARGPRPEHAGSPGSVLWNTTDRRDIAPTATHACGDAGKAVERMTEEMRP
jgi:hypothetical protein